MSINVREPRYSQDVPAHQKRSFYVKAFRSHSTNRTDRQTQTDKQTDVHAHTHRRTQTDGHTNRRDRAHYQPHWRVVINIKSHLRRLKQAFHAMFCHVSRFYRDVPIFSPCPASLQDPRQYAHVPIFWSMEFYDGQQKDLVLGSNNKKLRSPVCKVQTFSRLSNYKSP